MTPVPQISAQSWRLFGSGTLSASVSGTMTRIAMIRRIAANDTGGTSRTPSLTNIHTELQITQVRIQTKTTRIIGPCSIFHRASHLRSANSDPLVDLFREAPARRGAAKRIPDTVD